MKLRNFLATASDICSLLSFIGITLFSIRVFPAEIQPPAEWISLEPVNSFGGMQNPQEILIVPLSFLTSLTVLLLTVTNEFISKSVRVKSGELNSLFAKDWKHIHKSREDLLKGGIFYELKGGLIGIIGLTAIIIAGYNPIGAVIWTSLLLEGRIHPVVFVSASAVFMLFSFAVLKFYKWWYDMTDTGSPDDFIWADALWMLTIVSYILLTTAAVIEIMVRVLGRLSIFS